MMSARDQQTERLGARRPERARLLRTGSMRVAQHGARRDVQPRLLISGNQRQSEAIRGPLVAISGHQRAIRGPSEAISGNRW